MEPYLLLLLNKLEMMMRLIGRFRITLRLIFKTSRRAKPLICDFDLRENEQT